MPDSTILELLIEIRDIVREIRSDVRGCSEGVDAMGPRIDRLDAGIERFGIDVKEELAAFEMRCAARHTEQLAATLAVCDLIRLRTS